MIKVETNKIENRKTMSQLRKTEVFFFEKVNKINKLLHIPPKKENY